MKLRPIGAIVLRQYYLLRSSSVRLLNTVIWVVIDIVLWGFITRYLNTVNRPGVDLVPTLLGAVLLWDFCARVMQGVSTAFLEDIWSRNFLNLFASPLSISEYVTGLVITSIATSSIGLVAMLALATGVFGLAFFAFGLPFIAFLFVLFIFGTALGILGSAMVLRFGPASEWLVWPLPAVIAPFAGVFYPVATLPVWMQWIAQVLPPAYIFEGMRRLLAGEALAVDLLVKAIGLALVELVLSGYIYRRVYGRAVRTGLLARYTAESTI